MDKLKVITSKDYSGTIKFGYFGNDDFYFKI